MPRKPGDKAYRDQQRERLGRLGVQGRQLIEQLVVDLMRCGYRPREAWRLACELTQEEVARRFNRIRSDPDSRMRGSRICEHEKWPRGGVRPSVRALTVLAAVYQTTWERLVDVDDLEAMPACDRQVFLDISELRYGDSARREPAKVREPLTVPSRGSANERSGGGLPGDVTHFTGRDGPMAELRARIAEQAPQGPGARGPGVMNPVVTIYAIDGMAGVGKTAFARHAAQELATRYPDGAIWIDLYGHTPGMQPRGPSGALEQMLLQRGVPPEAIEAGLAERQDQWRHHIHSRRVLIVLDNAATSDQVLPLLPEAPGCLVLITSRRKLIGLTDAYPLSLDVLGWDEAEQLFIKLLGAQRCEDRDAVRQILAASGRLPLAIRLVAGRLRHHRGERLAEFAADFADQAAALDAFVAEHLSVRAAFEWSYRLLSDAQRQAFRLLGWHPGPEITPVVIAAVVDVSPGYGRQLLRELVDHNLLDQLSVAGVPGGPRYRMHDLVRLYARERADAEEPSAQRSAAVDRLAGSYLAITHEADRLLRPYVAREPDKSTARETVLAFADASQARSWLTGERPNLLGCVRAMSASTEAADLSTVLAVHFRDFGFWSDGRYLYGQALTIYRHLGDRRGEVDALWGLGYIERLVGEYGQARLYHTQALALARELGYDRAEADALGGLGQTERLVGEYGQARQYHTQALALAQQLDYRFGEADALRGLGQVERLVGEYVEARKHYTQALALARHLGCQRTEADALRGLGQVEQLVGEYVQAREYHTQALALARHLGYQFGEILALRELGQVERLVGEYGQARECHTQALALARHLGDRRDEAEALRGLGKVEQLVGEYGQARDYHTQALTLARQVGDRRAEAEALRELGQVEQLVGEYGQAREYHSEALALARHLGYRFGEVLALRGLGEVERLVGEYGQARAYYSEALTLARDLGYRFGEVLALRGLGDVERLVGKYARAREFHIQALTLARRLGDRFGEVLALWELGQVERVVGEHGQARSYYTQALTLARHLGFRRAEAQALRGLGEVERFVGDYGHAREYHTQAVTLARCLGDRPGEVLALRGLGEVERSVGEYAQAREYHSQALALARQFAYRFGEVLALRGLGEVERSVGEYGQARENHSQALALARQLGYRFGELLALRGLGEVQRSVGEYGEARDYHTQALTLGRQLGDRRAEAEALWGLGHVASRTAERGLAGELWGTALEIYEELGVPFAETVRAAIRRLGR